MMPFLVRSPTDLARAAQGYIRQYLPGTEATLRQNVLNVLARALGLAGHDFDLRMDWLRKQMMMSTATDEAWIKAHCADYRIFQKPASVASGLIETSGAPGQTYPAGIRYYSAGQTYLTTDPVVADGAGAVVVSVVSEQRGASANRDGGATLSLTDPALYPTLDQTAAVAADGIGGGADRESIESLRARGLKRKAETPQGGNLDDYEAFALDVPGVIKAWGHRFAGGPGTVGVYFLFEGRDDFIPEPADVAVVQEAIDARRMIRVDFIAQAPAAYPVDIVLSGVSINPETRAAVEAALRTMLYEQGRPSFAGDVGRVSRTAISNAVLSVVGDTFRLLAPMEDVVIPVGSYPVLGTILHA